MKEFVLKNKKIIGIALGVIVVGLIAFFVFVPKALPPLVAVAEVKAEVYVEPKGLFSCREDSDCVITHINGENCGCNNGGRGFMAINKDNKEYYEKFNPAPTNTGCPNEVSTYATCKPNAKVECNQNRCYIERGTDAILAAVAQANVPLIEQLMENGVPITATDREGRGVLYYAAVNDGYESESLRIVEMLLKKEVNAGSSLYDYLVKDGRLVLADYFVQKTQMPKKISLATFVAVFDPKNTSKLDNILDKQDFLLNNHFIVDKVTAADIESLIQTNPDVLVYLEKESDFYKVDKEKKEKKEDLAKLVKENPLKAITNPDTDRQSLVSLINIYEMAANEMPVEITTHYKSVIGYALEPLKERVKLNSSLTTAEKTKFAALARTIRTRSSDKMARYFDCRKPFICWRKKTPISETSYMWQPFCVNGCYYDILNEDVPAPTEDLVSIANLQEFANWSAENQIVGDYKTTM